MSKAIIVSGWLCCIACATGGSGDMSSAQQDAAVAPRHDAANVTTADAARQDSGVGQDAQVSQIIDGGTGSGSGGLFCSTNSQCTVSGECCVTLGGPNGFCAPGTVVLGECFPQ